MSSAPSSMPGALRDAEATWVRSGVVDGRRVVLRSTPELGGARVSLELTNPIAGAFFRERGGRVISVYLGGSEYQRGPTAFDLAAGLGYPTLGVRARPGEYTQLRSEGTYASVQSPIIEALFNAAQELLHADVHQAVEIDRRLRALDATLEQLDLLPPG